MRGTKMVLLLTGLIAGALCAVVRPCPPRPQTTVSKIQVRELDFETSTGLVFTFNPTGELATPPQPLSLR
jgi:hypothetical protein